MNNDPEIRTYKCVQSAATRYARLRGDTRDVAAIDYSRVHVDAGSGEHAQDIWLEKLQELAELGAMLDRAKSFAHPVRWAAWWCVRVNGNTQREVATATSKSTETIRRWLRKVDALVWEQLIEREVVEGYGGRDLLEAGGEYDRSTRLWLNEDAFKEK